MWTTEFPKKEGNYFFYGDPWWGGLPHDSEKNPFNPEKRIVTVMRISNGYLYCADGNFCDHPLGLFWTEPIEFPDLPLQEDWVKLFSPPSP